MNFETKPTAGALRAGIAIQEKTGGSAILARAYAEIVDRETGLPELLEACKGLLLCIGSFANTGTFPTPEEPEIIKAREAIAKAEVRVVSKPFWIKERYNPQLGTYYVACGQMSKTKAKKYERPLYGDNVMRRFDSEAAYQARLTELRKKGESVQ